MDRLMKPMAKKLLHFFICAPCLCMMFCACQKQEINIVHNSPVLSIATANAEQEKPKSVVKNSSGIIIYKDISSSVEENVKSISFGPRDINFDLPVSMKFK